MRIILLFLISSLFIPCSNAEPHNKPNIIMLMVDSTRADIFYQTDKFPNFKKLRDKSTTYKNAIAPSSYTVASMASILTGKTPSKIPDYFQNLYKNNVFIISKNKTTILNILKQNGYTTLVATQGYDAYSYGGVDEIIIRQPPQQSYPNDLVQHILSATNTNTKPFFLLSNIYDPHGPWNHTSNKNNNLTGSKTERYQKELGLVDQAIGRLLAGLEEKDFFNNGILIVFSDHGVFLDDRDDYFPRSKDNKIKRIFNPFHGFDLKQEFIHVPLIIAGKGIERGVTNSNFVETRNIYQFIKNILLTGDINLQNINQKYERYIISEGVNSLVRKWGTSSYLFEEKKAIIDKKTSMKLLYSPTSGFFELYNLENDPDETNNLFKSQIENKSINNIQELFSHLTNNSNLHATYLLPYKINKYIDDTQSVKPQSINFVTSQGGTHYLTKKKNTKYVNLKAIINQEGIYKISFDIKNMSNAPLSLDIITKDSFLGSITINKKIAKFTTSKILKPGLIKISILNSKANIKRPIKINNFNIEKSFQFNKSSDSDNLVTGGYIANWTFPKVSFYNLLDKDQKTSIFIGKNSLKESLFVKLKKEQFNFIEVTLSPNPDHFKGNSKNFRFQCLSKDFHWKEISYTDTSQLKNSFTYKKTSRKDCNHLMIEFIGKSPISISELKIY